MKSGTFVFRVIVSPWSTSDSEFDVIRRTVVLIVEDEHCRRSAAFSGQAELPFISEMAGAALDDAKCARDERLAVTVARKIQEMLTSP